MDENGQNNNRTMTTVCWKDKVVYVDCHPANLCLRRCLTVAKTLELGVHSKASIWSMAQIYFL